MNERKQIIAKTLIADPRVDPVVQASGRQADRQLDKEQPATNAKTLLQQQKML